MERLSERDKMTLLHKDLEMPLRDTRRYVHGSDVLYQALNFAQTCLRGSVPIENVSCIFVKPILGWARLTLTDDPSEISADRVHARINLKQSQKQYIIFVEDLKLESLLRYSFNEKLIEASIEKEGEYFKLSGPVQCSNLHALLSMTKYGVLNSWPSKPENVVLFKIALEKEIQKIDIQEMRTKTSQIGPIVRTRILHQGKKVGEIINLFVQSDNEGHPTLKIGN